MSALRAFAKQIAQRATVVHVAQWFDFDYRTEGRHPCPLCRKVSESKKTLALFEDGRRWWCFHCNDGGDVIDWLAAALGCSKGGAIRILASRLGIEDTAGSVSEYFRAIADQRDTLRSIIDTNNAERAVRRAYWAWAYKVTLMEPAEHVEWAASWDAIEAMCSTTPRKAERLAGELRHARDPFKPKRRAEHAANEFALRAFRADGGSLPVRRMIAERGWDQYACAGLLRGLMLAVNEHTRAGSGERIRLFDALVSAGVLNKSAQNTIRPAEAIDDRAVFCIRDLAKRACGFAGRATSDTKAKYVNTRTTRVFNKRRCLYLVDRAAAEIVKQRYAVVVEGYADAIALHERAGVRNAVATMGSRLSVEQAHALRRLADRAIILLDGDEAGREGTVTALESCASASLDVEVVRLPAGRDPDDMIAAGGASMDRLVAAIVRAAARAATRERTALSLAR